LKGKILSEEITFSEFLTFSQKFKQTPGKSIKIKKK
jgi:hypothetical protein